MYFIHIFQSILSLPAVINKPCCLHFPSACPEARAVLRHLALIKTSFAKAENMFVIFFLINSNFYLSSKKGLGGKNPPSSAFLVTKCLHGKVVGKPLKEESMGVAAISHWQLGPGGGCGSLCRARWAVAVSTGVHSHPHSAGQGKTFTLLHF